LASAGHLRRILPLPNHLYSETNQKLLQSLETIQPAHYKLNYEAFFVNYAFDDTSAALVNLFFSKRRNTYWGFMGMNGGLMAISLAGSKEEEVCISKPQLGSCLAEKRRVYEPWTTPVVLIGMGGALTYVSVRLSTFSRRKLLVILKDYANGKPIPPKFRQRVLVKHFPVR
jgi:hypothetical protein